MVVPIILDREWSLIFGDGDCGANEIHTRAREISSRRHARGGVFARALLVV